MTDSKYTNHNKDAKGTMTKGTDSKQNDMKRDETKQTPKPATQQTK